MARQLKDRQALGSLLQPSYFFSHICGGSQAKGWSTVPEYIEQGGAGSHMAFSWLTSLTEDGWQCHV